MGDMMNEEEPTLEEKCQILTDIFINKKDDDDWQEFVEYWNLTLPIAYAITLGLVSPNPRAIEKIDYAWSHAEVIENEPVVGSDIE
jgi:hypothetical protein